MLLNEDIPEVTNLIIVIKEITVNKSPKKEISLLKIYELYK
jgi:hypothetical protein